MDAETYPDSQVQKALSGWVVVRVEVTSEPEVARRCGVEGVPTLLALTAEGIEMGRVEGFVEPAELLDPTASNDGWGLATHVATRC